MKKSPCTTCKMQGCGEFHDRCKEFKAYRTLLDEVSKKRLQNSNVVGYIVTTQNRSRHRARTSKNQPFKTHKK